MSKELIDVPAVESCLVQSKDRCFPCELVLAKDTTNAHAKFEQFFVFIDIAVDGESD